jgi:ABC-type spermidine/putrescine transport system, permease component II
VDALSDTKNGVAQRVRGGASRGRRAFAVLWIVLAALYFITPLVATFLFSLKGRKGALSFAAYANVLADPQFLRTFLFSLEMAAATILLGLVLIVPTAIWVRLRLPKARGLMDFLALLPFVIPPIVLAFGLIKAYSRPPLSLASSPLLLVCGYVVICFPYIYRSVDSGLSAIDLKLLAEAAQGLGAGWRVLLFEVILPNIKSSLLSAAFLSLATVLGELTLAVLLAWPAFGPYMALVGRDRAYEPAALSIMSLVLTWAFVALIQVLGGSAIGSGAAKDTEAK